MLNVIQIIKEQSKLSELDRVLEPTELMTDREQVQSYSVASQWGGLMDGLHIYHLCRLARLIRPNDTVVDLCCGSANFLIKSAEIFPENYFIGIDNSEEMLNNARFQVKAKGLSNIEFFKDDVTNLKNIPNSFKADVVISTMAIHHLPNLIHLELFFIQVYKLLKNNGVVYIADLVRPKTESALNLFVRDVQNRTDLNIFTQDYKNSLQAAFSEEDIQTIIKKHNMRGLVLKTTKAMKFLFVLQSANNRVSFWKSKKINKIPIFKVKLSCWIEFVLLKLFVK